MVIDNTKVVVHDRKMMYMMAILLAVIIGTIIILSETYNELFIGISREIYIIIAAGIYIILNIIRYLQDLTYIFYSDQTEKITIKYYSLRPFAKKRQSFEIPKGSLFKYQVEKSFFGLKESVIIFQKIKNKIAKYPPVSISALSKEEKKQLFASLNSYSIQKPS